MSLYAPRIRLHRQTAVTTTTLGGVTIKPTWNSLRAAWPNANHSRFVDAASLRWHVQTFGDGPPILLLHGSGAATHTWRDLAPMLARRFTVVAPDLPGHGFTSKPDDHGMSMVGMAASVRELLRVLDVQPTALAGHSAGGSLALWLAGEWPVSQVIGLNAAIAPPNSLMMLLAPAVKALAGTGIVGALTAKLAESDFVFDSLMKSTGSVISREQLSLYRTLATSSEHSTALMSMFAGWDLPALNRKLPSVTNHVTLVTGDRDQWVPPGETAAISRLLPNVELVTIPAAGHLVHEERPMEVCEIITARLLQPRSGAR